MQWLLPYEDAIINLEDFQVTGLPEKMKLAREKHLTLNGNSTHTTIKNSQFVTPIINPPPPIYNPNPVPVLQTFSQPPVPIQFSHYNPPNAVFRPSQIVNPPVNIQVINNPNNYQVHVPSYIEPAHQGLQNYYAVNKTTTYPYQTHTSIEGPKFTLEQINQQLEESRKQFPQ